ncbi:hypothetical protein GALMADRAFT_272336 [Galerina marginata CBS 339.88]|uniref:Uncharacterized protein n=1 Tax=Galerina marginata (strain CBS 339.88) TaxID=685588 RepID=A0A067SCU0_GALM3|nr:hypothetical protein GALMADRAFT_272336 [Galerina marginata CBS 339.88]
MDLSVLTAVAVDDHSRALARPLQPTCKRPRKPASPVPGHRQPAPPHRDPPRTVSPAFSTLTLLTHHGPHP